MKEFHIFKSKGLTEVYKCDINGLLIGSNILAVVLHSFDCAGF